MNKRKILIIAAIALYCCGLLPIRVSAQTKFQIAIGGTGTEIGYSVQQTSDGGYIITGGSTSFGAGNNDVYLIKTDGSGNISWSKTFGGANNDEGMSVRQTSDGGYIISGNTSSFGAGNNDVYLIKTDGSGNISWSKTFGGTGTEFVYSVQQTSGGGYIITGGSSSFGAGGMDVYLIKTDGSGNISWSKTFGGTNDEWGSYVQQTSDGGYIIVGPTTSFGAGNYDVYLIKTDGSGNISWSKTFGMVNWDRGVIVQQTSDGGYVIGGGTSSSGAGSYDFYLVKTDGSGNISWSKTFGGTNADDGYFVQQTSDGGYVIGGPTISFGAGSYDFYLVKTDGSGNISWSKTFGGTNLEKCYFGQQTNDGGYIIVGSTMSFGTGANDIYLIKTD